MKILLVGNPNVGKSSLFSRLTGANVVCSNYPGSTVGFCRGRIRIGEGQAEVIDVPGTYSLLPQNPAEKITRDMISQGDIIVNVVDATNLERNLFLTIQLICLGKPVVVALNMADDARHLGVDVDRQALEDMLGVPVLETVAVSGEGVKELVGAFGRATSKPESMTDDEVWARIGKITSKVQKIRSKSHGFLEHIEDATIRPATGIPIAVGILFLTFIGIIDIGNLITSRFIDPFFSLIWGPLMRAIVEPTFPHGMVHDLLVGRTPDFVEGLGILTTGFYVPLAMILPFMVMFYFILSVLEDVGYLPRLATLMDNMMHRIGLHGSAIVPSVLGLGCRVPGMLATRMLETQRQRFIVATLLAVCVPCLAQNAVIFGLLSRYGINYVLIVYGTLAMLYILGGLVLSRLLPGASEEILLEIPPYRRPNAKSLAKKTWMRVRYFLYDAVPYIVLGVLGVNLLYLVGFMQAFSRFFGPVFSTLFGLPEEAVVALMLGFLRKDFAVGMLAPIPMSPMQLTVASTLLVTFAPCLATLTVMYRELGLKGFLNAMVFMALMTVSTGVMMRWLLL